MKNSANNPMHLGKRHAYVDSSPLWPVAVNMMAPEIFPLDLGSFFESGEAQEALLNDALAIGETGTIAGALGLIARARGMSRLAAETGIKRQQLYRALSENGNPTLETLARVVAALGYRLSARRGEGPPGGIDSGI